MRIVEATGAPFVDGAIIGAPSSPKFYMSGAQAAQTDVLNRLGLVVLLGPVGAASALKMSYAGITKGLTALGSAMSLAAMRNGADKALYDELAESRRNSPRGCLAMCRACRRRHIAGSRR